MNPKTNLLAPCVTSANRGPSICRQLGLTLIELMVALVIGLFLVMGAITVYLQSADTARTSDKVARLQEIGRYVFDVLEPDVQLAGHWGNAFYMPAGGTESNIFNTVADTAISPNCGTNWIGDATNYVEGRDNGANISATCSTSNTGGDTLVVRRTNAAPAAAVTASKVQLQSTRTGATIFNAATIPGIYNATSSVTHDVIVRAYYVTQAAAGSPFVLRRRTLSGLTFNEEDVIPGVQDLQVQFGIDRNGDNQVDQYVEPNATLGNRVISVRIWLLLVADEAEAGFQDPTIYAYANRDYGTAFTDGRRRVLLTKTIQIRNARLL